MNVRIILGTYLITHSMFLGACQWCVPYDEAVKMAQKSLEPSVTAAPAEAQPPQPHDADFDEESEAREEENKKRAEEMREIGRRFYREYMQKYYPNAWVITEYMVGMCPDAVVAGLEQMVDMLAHKPWYYFQNKPEGFNLADKWEVIRSELQTIEQFLHFSVVDEKTKLISEREALPYNKAVSLERYLMRTGKGDAVFRFYALFADWLNKLFNEAVMQEDINVMQRYHQRFGMVVAGLEGSKYEVRYKKQIRINNALIALIRHRKEEQQGMAKGNR